MPRAGTPRPEPVRRVKSEPRYFKTPASRLPTPAPPDFVTNDVRTGTTFATCSGFRPIFENAAAAAARLPADPENCDSAPDVPTTPPAAGAAFNNKSIPGTACAT